MHPIHSFSILYVAIIALLAAGCTSSEVHYDARQLRSKAADYYEDQIMDNLIRAKNGQLFIHVDISSLNSIVQTKVSATVNGGQSLKNSSAVADMATTIVREATRPFTFAITPELYDNLTVNTAPVLGDATVYTPYIQFLNLKSPASSFASTRGTEVDFAHVSSVVESDHKPAGGYIPGTLKKCEGKYYYVPSDYKRLYAQLCIALMMRPEPPENKKDGEPVKSKKATKDLQKQLQLQTDKLDQLRSLQIQ